MIEFLGSKMKLKRKGSSADSPKVNTAQPGGASRGNLGVPSKEKTIILLKPDGVKRGLIGEILSRFEKAGLKIVAMKMIRMEKNIAEKHYRGDEDYLKNLGEKTLKDYEKYGKDPKEDLGTKDPLELGKMIRSWSVEFISSGPVVAVLLEGHRAVENVRMMVGHTLPAEALPGTIRGDLSTDSALLGNSQRRAIKNLVHASGSEKEAKFEEELWFHQNEIYNYKRADEETMF